MDSGLSGFVQIFGATKVKVRFVFMLGICKPVPQDVVTSYRQVNIAAMAYDRRRIRLRDLGFWVLGGSFLRRCTSRL